MVALNSLILYETVLADQQGQNVFRSLKKLKSSLNSRKVCQTKNAFSLAIGTANLQLKLTIN